MTTFDDCEEAPTIFRLRGRQEEWCNKVEEDLKTFSRVLFIASGGVGKSTCFAELARRAHARGQKTLVIINRESLVRQSASRIRNETGLEVEVEMADERASPYAPVVVASVQTLGRVNRLTGFAPDHFALLVVDEVHLGMCEQWMRIMNWFHYGPDSLNDGWEPPSDGTYQPLASVIGFTATPILKGPKNLMNWFQHISVNYPYFLAVKEGWLVRAVQRCIPVKIDVRKARTAQTQVGTDFNATDLSAALVPVIEQLADQVLKEAGDRKTMAFLPSVETSKMLAEALCRRGMDACFVSGACEDGDEKTERFRRGGPGSVLCNAQIYNFGIDFPDVNCVAWFRATLSRPFYLQGVFRGTRVLPGVIDGIEEVGGRLRAIAASPKPDFLILDPLFMSDKISLCDAYDLFAETPEVKEQMKKEGLDPSQENAEKAERDMLAALEKAAKRAARKKARTIDPLAFAVSLGDDALAHYEPQTQRDAGPPSDKQLALLRQNGLDVSGVKSAGYASMLIGRILTRHRLHLATPKQLSMMTQLGLDEQTCATLSREEATATIDKLLAEKR